MAVSALIKALQQPPRLKHLYPPKLRSTVTNSAINQDMPVMALHCSSSDAGQWRSLVDAFGSNRQLLLPNLAGLEVIGEDWSMDTYTLEREARPLIEMLCELKTPSHLIGHSFGGAVALQIARSHPELVASLCLYEPSVFSLLDRTDYLDKRLFDDFEMLGRSIDDAVQIGFASYAAQVFTEFWGGTGAWQGLRRQRRECLVRWAPKAALEFGAVLYDDSEISVPLCMPVTVIEGSETHQHIRRVVSILTELIPQSRRIKLAGANHLGPFAFSDRVTALVKDHVNLAELQRINQA